MSNSTFRTLGGLEQALNELEARVDQLDPEAPSPVFSDVAFSVLTSSWTLSEGVYSTNIINSLFTAQCGIQVFYDDSFRTALAGDINAEQHTGYVTLSTNAAPIGTLSGFIRIMDSVSGLVPVVRGGTGAATPRQARANLNAPIRDIPVSFGTVTSLPQTIYDPDIRANMKGFGFVFSNPSAFPSGIDITFSDPSGNLGGAVTISGTMATGAESTVSFWAHEERSAAEGTETVSDVQRVQDFVQTNAQTLTAEQKAQVLENIGAASNASIKTIKTVRKTFVIASYGNCYIGNDFNELEYDGSNFINAFLDFQNNYGYLCIPYTTSSEGFCLKVKNTNTFSDAASGNYSGTLVYFEK